MTRETLGWILSGILVLFTGILPVGVTVWHFVSPYKDSGFLAVGLIVVWILFVGFYLTSLIQHLCFASENRDKPVFKPNREVI